MRVTGSNKGAVGPKENEALSPYMGIRGHGSTVADLPVTRSDRKKSTGCLGYGWETRPAVQGVGEAYVFVTPCEVCLEMW